MTKINILFLFANFILCFLSKKIFKLCFNTIPFILSIIIAGLVGFILAFVIGYPCLRVRGPYFVILTFGLAELIKFIVINVEAGMGKFGRLVFGAPSLEILYYLILLLYQNIF